MNKNLNIFRNRTEALHRQIRLLAATRKWWKIPTNGRVRTELDVFQGFGPVLLRNQLLATHAVWAAESG